MADKFAPDRRRRNNQLMAAVVVTFMLDQLSKYWLLNDVGLINGTPMVLTPWFSLVMVWNKGISFGMLSHSGQDLTAYLLTAVALVVSAILARLALKAERAERIAYGMIIGGAVGNAIDRVRTGAVADFFYAHLGDLGWPAFNVADSAICIGVFFLLLRSVRGSKVAK